MSAPRLHVVNALLSAALERAAPEGRTVGASAHLVSMVGTWWLSSRWFCLVTFVLVFALMMWLPFATQEVSFDTSIPTPPLEGALLRALLLRGLRDGALAGLIVVLLPWILIRMGLRQRKGAFLRAALDIFAAHRVTRAEWREARRLINANNRKLLRFGLAEQIERHCVEPTVTSPAR